MSIKRTMLIGIVMLVFAAVVLAGCFGADRNNPGNGQNTDRPEGGTFVDARDGRTYRTVRIGSRTWMAENLDYRLTAGGRWCYADDVANCDRYGSLYNWSTAMGACPDGWRLPANADWHVLIIEAGDTVVAGKALKAKAPNWDGDDSFGFSALPGGRCNSTPLGSGCNFIGIGENSRWWNSTESGNDNAYRWNMDSRFDDATNRVDPKSTGMSVRCVRN